MNPYSLYIGPAGPFSIFPSSRLKRRPSHCELELAEGEYGLVSAWGPCLSCTFPQGEVLPVHTDTHRGQSTQGSVLALQPCAKPQSQQPVPHDQSPNKPQRVLANSMAQGSQNDSATRMHSHQGSSHMTTPLQETGMGPQPHRRQPHNHSHLGPWPHKSQPHNRNHA